MLLKKYLGIAILLFAARLEAALPLNFTDVKGFRKCLDTKPFEEISGSPAAKHYIDQDEIRDRCIARAAEVMKKEKDEKVLASFLKEARSGGFSFDFDELINVATQKSKKLCNDTVAYDEIVKLFKTPTGERSMIEKFKKFGPVLDRCMADQEFKADFKSDTDGDATLKANVCKYWKKGDYSKC